MARSTRERRREKATKYVEDWVLAIKMNKVWDLVTEFLSVETELMDDIQGMVREYVDRTIEIMTVD